MLAGGLATEKQKDNGCYTLGSLKLTRQVVLSRIS